ncbi:glycosyltransferase family 2 protein [Salinispirillum marinum]|uniref:Glycosyltransferase family 2 protein n=2 Tax=Saccharospirillaceae TaxID=255527 RepID=A0ABV8BAM0_9GAMM
MSRQSVRVSVVIPALNEVTQLPDTLRAVARELPDAAVVVADNGSTDGTQDIARAMGATVLDLPGLTIAALRNRGAAAVASDVLVFIDADVLLGEGWGQPFQHTTLSLQAEPMQVTGSRCLPEDTQSYVGRYWYPLLNRAAQVNYINSGHLIVPRTLFDQISGFAEHLKTGEDHDFCQRAIAVGGVLKPEPDLRVFHRGYPNTVAGFMRREMWHGRSDFASLGAVLRSAVAMVALGCLAMLLAGLVGTVITLSLWPIVMTWLLSYSLCIGLVRRKFGRLAWRPWLHAAWLFYLYLIARSMSWSYRVQRPKERSGS